MKIPVACASLEPRAGAGAVLLAPWPRGDSYRQLILPAEALNPDDRVLIVSDFLGSGNCQLVGIPHVLFSLCVFYFKLKKIYIFFSRFNLFFMQRTSVGTTSTCEAGRGTTRGSCRSC